MNTLSWIYMLTVWALIIALNTFCFCKAFKKPKVEPLDESLNNHVKL